MQAPRLQAKRSSSPQGLRCQSSPSRAGCGNQTWAIRKAWSQLARGKTVRGDAGRLALNT